MKEYFIYLLLYEDLALNFAILLGNRGIILNHIDYFDQKITPSKIICIGRNYVEHIRELNNEIPDDMVVFNKPNSAMSSQLQAFHQEPLHYEAELALLYQQGKFVAVAFGLDLTKRQLQKKLKDKGLPWERAKAFDGSALFSSFVTFQCLEQLSLKLLINEKLIQIGGVDLMMYKPEQILKELQSFMTLNDGDIVMTGTPKGVGEVKASDIFHGQVFEDDTLLIEQVWHAK